MRLADFAAAVGPFLQGSAEHAETVRALWGEQPPQPDAARLAIYGRFCRAHRFESVDKVFAETRAAVLALAGEAAWAELVEAHYRAYPMSHAELNENGLTLPAFLARSASAYSPTAPVPPPGFGDIRRRPDRGGALPPWLAELADLEAWEWRTWVAPDAPADADAAQGPLRVAGTVQLRAYAHDLVGWLDGEPRPAAPEARPARVLFWRDGDLDARREPASDFELALLRRVLEGGPLHDPPLGPRALVEETLADLRAAGILLGAP